MTLTEFLVLLVIGGVSGAISQSIVGWSRGGCFASIGVGFVGSALGTYLARSVGLPELFTLQVGGVAFPIVWSILGGTLFVAFLALISRSGRRRR
ncbi:MAG: hypothetical protein AAF725_07325 [Acidobacteriota bacterium]